MKLSEMYELDTALKREIDDRRISEIKSDLQKQMPNDEIEVTSLEEMEYFYRVHFNFVLDGYLQEDTAIWGWEEDQSKVVERINELISYVKELRDKYPAYCKANDYLQTNRIFSRSLVFGDYPDERHTFSVKLCKQLKLPNRTETGLGGGDYEVRNVPENVDRFNKRIDMTIDFLFDCISDLKKMKYKEDSEAALAGKEDVLWNGIG